MWDKVFGAGHPTLTSWELGKLYGGKKVRTFDGQFTGQRYDTSKQ